MWLALTSLVSYGVLNYPMGALIERQTLLIVSLEEGGIDGRKGELAGVSEQSRGQRVGDSVSVSDPYASLNVSLCASVTVQSDKDSGVGESAVSGSVGSV